jgi:hypothetical protein
VGELNFGQIVFMVGFIVLLLIRFLRQRARRRPESREPDQMVPEASAVPLRPLTQAHPGPQSTPRSSGGRVRESRMQSTRPPLGECHFIKKTLLENPHHARRGIILMTLLGPCRAFDPPE